MCMRAMRLTVHLPDNTNALINFVHDKQSNIDGILTAYQNGLVGGNVYFLNPYGIYIGESGSSMLVVCIKHRPMIL